ncbi:hypothetical protein TSST111916_19070 [Tsukamurella strandjordii]|uniref:hypothetical protein n=1 Tax=Tsukamurella TaxID=2060 RepID=UPI001C7CE403|nr:hypothetical protein [Tsukamurella sp. TY48]
MAKRTGSNVVGDLRELEVTGLLLEHGLAINALTSSDTGWDLHCHVPDDLIYNASLAGTQSWTLSGHTAHIQVKAANRDKLRLGTVQGWITGTASGVPTFMFGTLRGNPVFCAPVDLQAWLRRARIYVSDDEKHAYTYMGRETVRQAPITIHPYKKARFPSVLRLWTHRPTVALAVEGLTAWVNHETDDLVGIESVVEDLANAIWADEGVNRDTESCALRTTMEQLYRAAGVDEAEERIDGFLTSGEPHRLTHGDGKFTRETVSPTIARLIVSEEGARRSAVNLLESLVWLRNTEDGDTNAFRRQS